MKTKENLSKGITLIALVVTIVVLLILAGVSISMLTGEEGIIKQAVESKEETRGGAVEEAKDLWKTDIKLDKTTGSNEAQKLEELLANLESKQLLTNNEVKEIKKNGYIQIASHFIDFRTDDFQGEIDYSKLEPGLYQKGTTNLIYSWEELKNNGDIQIDNITLTKVSEILEGDLVISNEIQIIGNSITSLLGSTCGAGYAEITKIYIPANVRKISKMAFEGFSDMEEVIMANGVQEIGDYAFSRCFKLKNFEIPDSVTAIESCIFDNQYASYSSLKTIYIPSSVTSIEQIFYVNGKYADVVIYCECSEDLASWDENWNLVDILNGEQPIFATVKYGYTREQYRAEIGQ